MTVGEPIVVVGTGPCGSIAAASLVARGLDVLLLDAGLRAPRGLVVKGAGNTIARFVSQQEMSSDRHDNLSPASVDWFSSRSLGGLSNYWTAAVPRFAPDDFADAARLDERYEWPVTYKDLVPFYERTEEYLSVTSGAPIPGVPINVRRFEHRPPADWATLIGRANSAGHGVGVMPMAKGRRWMIARRGTEFGSYHCIVEPLLGSERLELRTGAEVVGLRWSSGAGRVEAIEYLDRHSGATRWQSARAVVLAAGAIDTTLILLRSISGDFPDGLGNTHGVLGRYLHDHPREWWVGVPAAPMTALAHPVYVARTPVGDSHPGMATSLTIGLANRSARLRTYVRGTTPQFGVQVFGTMLPRPEIGVRLGDTGRPLISLRYDDATAANVVAARERLVEVFADASIALRIPGPFHDLVPGSSVHYGGTARMHHRAEFGVVDGWNRVHGVPNVVVADSSSFTTGPEKNPTLTAMALAVRASERLGDDIAAGAL